MIYTIKIRSKYLQEYFFNIQNFLDHKYFNFYHQILNQTVKKLVCQRDSTCLDQILSGQRVINAGSKDKIRISLPSKRWFITSGCEDCDDPNF